MYVYVERASNIYICVYKIIDIFAYSSFKFTLEADSIFWLPAQKDQKLQNFRVLQDLLVMGQKTLFLLLFTAILTTVWQTY